jgi:guanylate cyclase soluble subunit beta
MTCDLLTKIGRILQINLDIIFMTSKNVAILGDHKHIEIIIFLMEDNIESQQLEQMIFDEQQKISNMLENIIPPQIVCKLSGENEPLSFAVNSITVASINVVAQAKWDYTDNASFTFFNNIFDLFDQMINDFPNISKIQSFSHTYIIAGGIFMTVNKPEKHVVEVINCCLKMLKLAQTFQSKFGYKTDLTIGIHTGGPAVYGIISKQSPKFQILSPIKILADELMHAGNISVIHISRFVYELIFFIWI